MKISSREMVLAWLTSVAVLGGITYVIGKPRVDEWKDVVAQQQDARRKIETTQRLVAQAPQWNAKLAELRKKLPVYPPDKDVTADLGIKIDNMAKAHELRILSSDTDKESLKGDMYELAANCKWEGTLDALVRFLFDLQNEDAILDVSQLTVSPNEKKALRGGFTVYCSYSSVGKESRKPEPKAPEK